MGLDGTIENYFMDFSQPTSPHREWLFPIFPPENPFWIPVVCVFPALLATILIFMDQQITAVIINRKENKLKVCLFELYRIHFHKNNIN